MKLKTYLLTLGILMAILGASVGSAVLAYRMGTEALKGVSPPDVNPTNKFSTSQQITARPKPFKPINEKDILKKVDIYIQNQKTKPRDKKEPPKTVEPKPSPSAKEIEAPPQKRTDVLINFPLRVKEQNMTLEITKATYQGESLLLNISLKNEGEKAVQFLYSFLEIQDSQGQILSAITEGLPSEIPANGQTFQGTVEIPISLIEKSQLISLKLSDYPEQKVNLALPNIPISQNQEVTATQ
ncbi:hypothetical protein C7H19_21295 [Aphanothece hegewaldii CCALA 016]|uniref:Uncharacterized protein n=1 Tax=Aphanothece hegewaldii CCALA 016 TaxID=2107694 RepID=A0A2T1LSM9_9CHRO|nr:hypothetical protein [Aphanothece hegewaldii]PSF32663.1 hypothetical protein C7H19_21295 [Aphanothece hegewaldii CCALA 016]